MRKVPKEEIAKALRKSKELEHHQPLPKEEAVGLFREGIQRLDSLKDLLRGAWFIRDRDARARKSLVRAMPAKKGRRSRKASASRKKQRRKRSSRRK